jgi:hypothetical protein
MRMNGRKIVENAGGRLGELRQATLGVFQITAQNSSEEFSWRGNYNTASRRKTATVTMRLEYEAREGSGALRSNSATRTTMGPPWFGL